MITLGNNTEGNRFESERQARPLPVPVQELYRGKHRILSAEGMVEVSISGYLVEVAQEQALAESKANAERARQIALAKAAQIGHDQPEIPAETPVATENSANEHTEIIENVHGQLDAEEIRDRIKNAVNN